MAALSLWTDKHVFGLLPMCALYQLKFHHIAFMQGSALFSCYRRAMDKDIWTVTASDKAISSSIREPFHFSNHLAFFRTMLASESDSS